MKKLKTWLVKVFLDINYFYLTLYSFLAMISAVQINSWLSDRLHIKEYMWWIVVGIFAVLAIRSFLKARKNTR